MGPNKRAGIILLMLVLSAAIVFHAEKKFLVVEKRGSALTKYSGVADLDKVMLLIDDFEGINSDSLNNEGFFSFGSARISIDHGQVDKDPKAAKADLMVEWTGAETYGGWGRGVGANIDLNTQQDHISFRIYLPASNGAEETIKVIMEEDDNDNGKLEKEVDDIWFARVNIKPMDSWQTVSIPLKEFKDENEGGDHFFNVTRKGGLHNVIFAFEKAAQYNDKTRWYFDFICLSNEKLSESNITN